MLLRRFSTLDRYNIAAIISQELLKFTLAFSSFKNHPQKAHPNNIVNHYLLWLSSISIKETTSRPFNIYKGLFSSCKNKKEKITSNQPPSIIILAPHIICKPISLPVWLHTGKVWPSFSAKKVQIALTVPLSLPILGLSMKSMTIFMKQQCTTKKLCKFAASTT